MSSIASQFIAPEPPDDCGAGLVDCGGGGGLALSCSKLDRLVLFQKDSGSGMSAIVAFGESLLVGRSGSLSGSLEESSGPKARQVWDNVAGRSNTQLGRQS